MSREMSFVEVAGILVNPEIFSRPYGCNVEKYNCKSMCCYRSCIVPPDEAERVERHLEGIVHYLSPENRAAVLKNGGILGKCERQCPTGCVIHEDEARAIHRHFGGRDFRCVLLFNNDCALLFTSAEGHRYCAVHAYAMHKGLAWEEFKFSDCVQYPLSFYHLDDGRQVMSIQDTPYLSHIPCMKDPSGEPMYKNLRKTIERFLGKKFYNELVSVAEKLVHMEV